PDGHGYELVSSVRALVPQKFGVEEELTHVKHVEVKSPHVGVMWKFGRGVISSGWLMLRVAARWIVWSVPLEIVGSSGHEKVPTRGKPGLERPGRPRGERIEGSCGKRL
ncbi:hypothetical protein TNCV_4677441, partial [Trichonephila clavipes]